MKFSTRGRYGLRIVIELADRSAGGKPVLLETLAKSQDLPRQYLHHLLGRLRSAGLVRAVRGRGGGYGLAKPPSKMTAGDVLRALEGPLAPVDCLLDERVCRRAPACAARGLWQELAREMDRVLSAATIEKLAAAQRAARESLVAYEI